MKALTHLDFAHQIWAKIVLPGDTCIDATAGNGHDSFVLATYAGKLIAFDIQEQAIQNTKLRLSRFNQDQIQLYQMCHSKMAEVVAPKSAKLIVFNLGYLPGGDKELTTARETTLSAIKASLDLVQPFGLVSITCYPGHDEGLNEERAIVQFCEGLDPKQFSVSSHRFPYRKSYPHLLLIQPTA